MRKPTLQFATRPMRRLMDARWALCLAGLFVVSGVAQNAPPHGGMLPQPTGQRSLDGLEPNGPDGSIEQEKHLRALNAERQRALVSDTNKLFRLANELGTEISRDNPTDLTADQLHKIAEIEKLAHSVKDKMILSVRGNPRLVQPFSFPR